MIYEQELALELSNRLPRECYVELDNKIFIRIPDNYPFVSYVEELYSQIDYIREYHVKAKNERVILIFTNYNKSKFIHLSLN